MVPLTDLVLKRAWALTADAPVFCLSCVSFVSVVPMVTMAVLFAPCASEKNDPTDARALATSPFAQPITCTYAPAGTLIVLVLSSAWFDVEDVLQSSDLDPVRGLEVLTVAVCDPVFIQSVIVVLPTASFSKLGFANWAWRLEGARKEKVFNNTTAKNWRVLLNMWLVVFMVGLWRVGVASFLFC